MGRPRQPAGVGVPGTDLAAGRGQGRQQGLQPPQPGLHAAQLLLQLQELPVLVLEHGGVAGPLPLAADGGVLATEDEGGWGVKGLTPPCPPNAPAAVPSPYGLF